MARSAQKTPGTRSARTATARASAAGKSMAETVSDAAESVQDAGLDMARRVGRSARAAGQSAMERAEEARSALSETGDRLSDRLRRAASHAEEIAQEIPARLSDAAAQVRGSAVGDIAADLRHMAKRNPGVFIAGAALAGFALARLLAPRRDRDD